MYRFKITIDRTKVSGNNTNFVYLFSERCDRIPVGFWSHVIDTSNGLDIRFFDSDGVTELKREVVTYSYSDRTVEIWVQIPFLGISSNKNIYCQYGGKSVENSTGVWSDINATGVYHYQNLANDSLGLSNMSIVGASQVLTGKINKAYSFDGNDYMSVTKSMHSGKFTISVWAYVTGNAPNSYKVVTVDSNNNSYFFSLTDTDSLGVYGGIGWGIARYSGGWVGTYSGDTYVSQKDSWHKIDATYDGDKFRIYVDGILKNTSISTSIPSCGTGVLVGEYNSNFWMTGTLEELRYFSDEKTGDWIKTEYNNQNYPSTFSFCDLEEDVNKTYRFPITINKNKIGSIDGNTIFKDETGKAWSAYGNAVITTNTYKFSPGSGYFDGVSGTYINTPDSPDFFMGTSNFTIDFWMNTTQTGDTSTLFCQGNNSGTPSTFSQIFNLNYPTSNKVSWCPNVSAYPSSNFITSTTSVNDGSWHHIACVRNGDVFTLYVDGVSEGSVTLTGYSVINSTYPFYIGVQPGFYQYNGYIDEFRISKGIARWATSFTPPSDKYLVDDYTKVLLHFGNIGLENFTYLFSENTKDIPVGLWSHVIGENGEDIRFYDTNGIRELKREIVTYDIINKKIEAWVQIPILSSLYDKKIWCQYGGSSKQNDTEVWDNINAKAVYHLNGVGNDSTINSNNGTITGAVSTLGKIDNALLFNGSSNYVNKSTPIGTPIGTSNFSMSFWFRPDLLNRVTDQNFFIYGTESNHRSAYFVIYNSMSIIRFEWWGANGRVESNSLTQGQWYYAVATYDGINSRLYINGSIVDTIAYSSSNLGSTYLSLGRYSGGYYAQGAEDEARIYSIALSSDWIATEYANQNDPDTFSICGAESNTGENVTVLMSW